MRVYQDPNPVILQAGKEKLQAPQREIIIGTLGSAQRPNITVVNRGILGASRLQLILTCALKNSFLSSTAAGGKCTVALKLPKGRVPSNGGHNPLLTGRSEVMT